MTVSFCGHRDAPESCLGALRELCRELIEERGADHFLLGREGRFDHLVRRCLEELAAEYPGIRVELVLAYLEKRGEREEFSFPTVYPEGLEKVPPAYAIPRRNRWMLERSDLVVAFVTHITGGAHQYRRLAEKRGIPVINLADPLEPGSSF